MNVQFRPEPSASVSVKTAIADCDIHPARASNDELFPFMAKRWHEHLEAYGKQAYHGMMEGPPYPKAQPNASRRDAWPPEGGPQGSSLSFMQKQLLDPYNVALGVLNPLNSGQGLRNQDLAGAKQELLLLVSGEGDLAGVPALGQFAHINTLSDRGGGGQGSMCGRGFSVTRPSM